MTMHEGHRKRMRERFRKDGLDGFADHEVLELLLFYGRARGDVNPLAHTLMDTFGSLQGVLEARPDQLMAVPGVGEETATLLSTMLPVFRRYTECICREKKRFDTRQDMKQFCKALLSGWRTERFYTICLTADNQLLGQRLIAEGSVEGVHAYPRRVVEAALNLNARAVVLCHNHPGGSNWPSQQDIASTEQIRLILKGMDIILLDHIIVAGEDAYSMVEHGDIAQGYDYAPVLAAIAADSGGQIMHKKASGTGTKGKETT